MQCTAPVEAMSIRPVRSTAQSTTVDSMLSHHDQQGQLLQKPAAPKPMCMHCSVLHTARRCNGHAGVAPLHFNVSADCKPASIDCLSTHSSRQGRWRLCRWSVQQGSSGTAHQGSQCCWAAHCSMCLDNTAATAAATATSRAQVSAAAS